MAKLLPIGGIVVKDTSDKLVAANTAVFKGSEGGVGGPATHTGTISASLSSMTLAASGTAFTAVSGDISGSLSPMTLTANGSAFTVVSGDVSAALSPMTLAASGSVASGPLTHTGSITAALSPVAAALSGNVVTELTGAISGSFGALTMSASGTIETPPPETHTGAISAAMGPMSIIATGAVFDTVNGDATLGLAPLTASALGTVIKTHEAVTAMTLSAMTVSINGGAGDVSNYTKLTDFAAKDSLPSGNPLKRVSGAELDAEFEAIEASIATKANKASPTFTGTATFNIVSVNTLNGRVVTDLFATIDDNTVTFEADPDTKTLARASAKHIVYRETAAAVVYTLDADSASAWQAGDEIVVYVGNGCNVTVNRAGTGVFTLPDGTTSTTLVATTAGTIRLVNPAGDDNWTLIQQ